MQESNRKKRCSICLEDNDTSGEYCSNCYANVEESRQVSSPRRKFTPDFVDTPAGRPLRKRKATTRYCPTTEKQRDKEKLIEYKQLDFEKKEKKIRRAKQLREINQSRAEAFEIGSAGELSFLDMLAETIHVAGNGENDTRSTTAVVLTEDEKIYCFCQRYRSGMESAIKRLNIKYQINIIMRKNESLEGTIRAEAIAYYAWLIKKIRRTRKS